MNIKTILSGMMIILADNTYAEITESSILSGDSAIQRVENCECYKHINAQNLEPWELEWKNPEALRKQISHCKCTTHIDIQKVENPSRYIVPGTILK